MREVRQAPVNVGRIRADPAVYADRFVADWQAGSTERVTAKNRRDVEKADRRMERLNEQVQREPMLDRTLDQLPGPDT